MRKTTNNPSLKEDMIEYVRAQDCDWDNMEGWEGFEMIEDTIYHYSDDNTYGLKDFEPITTICDNDGTYYIMGNILIPGMGGYDLVLRTDPRLYFDSDLDFILYMLEILNEYKNIVDRITPPDMSKDLGYILT